MAQYGYRGEKCFLWYFWKDVPYAFSRHMLTRERLSVSQTRLRQPAVIIEEVSPQESSAFVATISLPV
jgi:hypothetical protein